MKLFQTSGSKFNNPLFSLILASYNKDEYVGQTIKSVLDQTYKNWELVIVDDNSTDNSVGVIKEFLIDPRIRLEVNESNIGYPNTLDKMIKLSKGDIIGIIDCDDTLEPNAVREVVNMYQKNPRAEFIYTQFKYCDENLNYIKKGYCKKIPDNKSNLHMNVISHFKTFTKELYMRSAGYNEKIINADDKDIIFKLEELSKPVFLDKELYNFRQLPQSMSHGRKKRSGEINFVKAVLHAYRRRKGTTVPNLNRFQMMWRILKASYLCVKEKDVFNFLYFEFNKFLVLLGK